MPNVGPWEIILLLMLALLLFGAKRLPEIGRSVGQGMREFKDSVRNHTEDMREATSEIRAEVDGIRQTANETSTDIRKELTPVALDE